MLDRLLNNSFTFPGIPFEVTGRYKSVSFTGPYIAEALISCQQSSIDYCFGQSYD